MNMESKEIVYIVLKRMNVLVRDITIAFDDIFVCVCKTEDEAKNKVRSSGINEEYYYIAQKL